MNRSFLLAPLLALVLLPAGPASAHQGPTAAPTAGALGGHAGGRFDLPDPTGAGHLFGQVRLPDGTTLFHLKARVERDPLLRSGGRIVGVATLAVGRHAGLELPLRGRWEARRVGQGVLEASLLSPRRGAGGRSWVELEGAFDDPRPLAPGGTFRARWEATR